MSRPTSSSEAAASSPRSPANGWRETSRSWTASSPESESTRARKRSMRAEPTSSLDSWTRTCTWSRRSSSSTVRPARASAGNDGGRRRSARDRERARHGRRPLAHRRLRGDPARGLLHGFAMRAGVRVRCPGASSTIGDLEGLLHRRHVLGLAEMMNFFRLISGAPSELAKFALARHVDGHAPGVTGMELNAYAAARIRSDHEAATATEGRDGPCRAVAAHTARPRRAQPRGAGPLARECGLRASPSARMTASRSTSRRRSHQRDDPRCGRARHPARRCARDGIPERCSVSGSTTSGPLCPGTRRTCSFCPISSRSSRSSC